ncbi:MAG: hypothetical protein R3B99_11940 [Polyangiales bacterium]
MPLRRGRGAARALGAFGALSGVAASEGASSDTNVGVPRWLAFAAIAPGLLLSPALFPWRFSTGAVGWIEWAQIAELGGPPMLDSCSCLSAARRGRRCGARVPCRIVVGALALGGLALYGAWRLPQVEAARASAPAIEVGVVQPNVSIEEKHDIRPLRTSSFACFARSDARARGQGGQSS